MFVSSECDIRSEDYNVIKYECQRCKLYAVIIFDLPKLSASRVSFKIQPRNTLFATWTTGDQGPESTAQYQEEREEKQ